MADTHVETVADVAAVETKADGDCHTLKEDTFGSVHEAGDFKDIEKPGHCTRKESPEKHAKTDAEHDETKATEVVVDTTAEEVAHAGGIKRKSEDALLASDEADEPKKAKSDPEAEAGENGVEAEATNGKELSPEKVTKSVEDVAAHSEDAPVEASS